MIKFALSTAQHPVSRYWPTAQYVMDTKDTKAQVKKCLAEQMQQTASNFAAILFAAAISTVSPAKNKKNALLFYLQK